jgi:hypothetical protein
LSGRLEIAQVLHFLPDDHFGAVREGFLVFRSDALRPIDAVSFGGLGAFQQFGAQFPARSRACFRPIVG